MSEIATRDHSLFMGCTGVSMRLKVIKVFGGQVIRASGDGRGFKGLGFKGLWDTIQRDRPAIGNG
jgi:hypothetical protein